MDISVVIPVYNVEKYLKDCLDSVVCQTVSFAEIIVVDDGSTDASLPICNDYARNHAHISVLHQENQKQGAARNNGLKKVKSKYVMFLDSDDMLRANTVERLQEELEKQDLDVLYFDADTVNEAEGYKETYSYNREGIVSCEIRSGVEYFEQYYPEGYVVQPGMAVYKTKLLQECNIRFPEGVFYEDNFFALKCMLEAKRVRYLSEKFYIRRYRESSVITSNMTFEKFQNVRDVFFLCWEYLAGKKEYTGEKKSLFLVNTYMEIKWALEKCNLSQISLADELEKIVQHLAKTWNNLSDVENFTFYTAKKLLSFAGELDVMWETEILSLVLAGGDHSLIAKCKRSYLTHLEKQIEKLPLNIPERSIGIYGMGAHTRRLLKWYIYFKGEIKCRLYFVDTYKESFRETFLGCDVVNIRDAKEYVDAIIISSDRYERQMKESIKLLYGDSMNTIEFYDKEKENIFISLKCIRGGIISKLKGEPS